MTLLYICRNHPGLGEMFAGQASAEEIKASGCRLCEIEKLKNEMDRLKAELEKAKECDHRWTITPAGNEWCPDCFARRDPLAR